MERDLVIKALYGYTLRRFSVSFNENGFLELDMAGLRTKIFNLFKLAPDADHTLSYVDEDSDTITLVDDGDLYDAIKQHLNPLRIHVTPKSDSAKVFDQGGSSTPLIPFPNSLGCSPFPPPAFYPLPPFPSAPMGFRPVTPITLQVSRNLASNASSSIKVDPLAQQPLFSPSSTGITTESHHDCTPKLSDTTVPKTSDALCLEDFMEMAVKNEYNDSEKSEDFKTRDDLKTKQVPRDLASNASSSTKAAPLGPEPIFVSSSILAGIDPMFRHNYNPKLSDTTVPKTGNALCLEDFIEMTYKEQYNGSEKLEDLKTKDLKRQLFSCDSGKMPQNEYYDFPSANPITRDDSEKSKDIKTRDNIKEKLFSFNSGKIPQKGYYNFPSANPIAFCGPPKPSTTHPVIQLVEPPCFQQINDSVNGQMAQNASNAGLPWYLHPQRINGVNAANPMHNLVKPGVSPQSATHPSWFMPPGRINGKGDTMSETFHRGVRCDGCGLHPITGPRFKSKVRVDYDLCSVCFATLGNDTDYTRLDHPICYNSSRMSKFPHPRVARPLLLPNSRRRCRSRSLYQPRLDSQFIKDVNIVDGTLMAPLTPFTKIWRMHNNGAVSWPRGTQLVWMGGERLTDIASVELELPDEGCLVGMELNIAIDLTAPTQPGHYVSYWRMALPSGDKFGECIWVFIQVDASLRDIQCGIQNLNLNLPPANVDLKHDNLDVKIESGNASSQNHYPDKLDAELVKPVANGNTSEEMEAMVDYLLSSPPEVPAVGSLPKVATSVIPESAGATDVHMLSAGLSDGINLEQSLLRDLEDMGFKEIDLNRKILRANHYDLDRSLDDLCSVPMLDLMLEELQQMGFTDKETNKMLLIKNGGSIKRVVKDLIASEKA